LVDVLMIRVGAFVVAEVLGWFKKRRYNVGIW
jgi:hypothetical protein